MRLANIHMEEALNEFIHRILEEGRAATREKVAERIRAKLPTPQTKIGDTTTAKELKKKGKLLLRDREVLENKTGMTLEVEPHGDGED